MGIWNAIHTQSDKLFYGLKLLMSVYVFMAGFVTVLSMQFDQFDLLF